MNTLTTKEFRIFYKTKIKKLSSNNFTIHYKSGDARLGISVSKKYYKLAKDRNLLKRWIKEWFKNYSFTGSVNILVASHMELTNSNRDILQQELLNLIKKIN